MPDEGRVLVVDDDADIRSVLEEVLSDGGFNVDVAVSGEEALVSLSSTEYDLVITDVRMAGMDGLELQRRATALSEHTQIIVISAFADIPMSVLAMRQGAYDFLTKPFASIDRVVMVARRAVEKARMAAKIEQLAASVSKKDQFEQLIGASSEMQMVYQRIRHLAKTDSTVLLLGETGTGKELTAKAIHNTGKRKDAPFIAVNFGSLPESLLESELFGHTKGSFTGASSSKMGLFAAASGGSILLDEIEAAHESTQIALLRVLDSKEVRPIGSSTPQKVDVRVFAASNEDLESRVESGTFRKDLYYRLISAIITLPPLRKRRADLPLLAEYFLIQHCKTHGSAQKQLSPRAHELMMSYEWPGNVRELKHAIEHGIIFSNGPAVLPKDLPKAMRDKTLAASKRFLKLADIEREHVERALQLSAFNIAKAAKLLGLTRQALYRKIERHGIGPDTQNDR
ncbi:sigma-54-dependent Fis family transcriptional regulator [bacterium]|nr:sigma-54-dependent Fis family transcriptional regulator [bacterium]